MDHWKLLAGGPPPNVAVSEMPTATTASSIPSAGGSQVTESLNLQELSKALENSYTGMSLEQHNGYDKT